MLSIWAGLKFCHLVKSYKVTTFQISPKTSNGKLGLRSGFLYTDHHSEHSQSYSSNIFSKSECKTLSDRLTQM